MHPQPIATLSIGQLCLTHRTNSITLLLKLMGANYEASCLQPISMHQQRGKSSSSSGKGKGKGGNHSNGKANQTKYARRKSNRVCKTLEERAKRRKQRRLYRTPRSMHGPIKLTYLHIGKFNMTKNLDIIDFV